MNSGDFYISFYSHHIHQWFRLQLLFVSFYQTNFHDMHTGNSDECEAWEAENGPYEKGNFMVKSNARTKGR